MYWINMILDNKQCFMVALLAGIIYKVMHEGCQARAHIHVYI